MENAKELLLDVRVEHIGENVEKVTSTDAVAILVYNRIYGDKKLGTEDGLKFMGELAKYAESLRMCNGFLSKRDSQKEYFILPMIFTKVFNDHMDQIGRPDAKIESNWESYIKRIARYFGQELVENKGKAIDLDAGDSELTQRKSSFAR